MHLLRSLAIGQEAAFPRQRRPSLPKVSAEQLNAQGWARELPVASGAGEGEVHEALQVNPAQGSELQAPFRAERQGRGARSARKGIENDRMQATGR